MESVSGKPGFSTAEGRWSAVGPYYAMFPIDFAFRIVEKYCPKGGMVLDPFAGRGSSIYAAAAQNRNGVGIEINPVGWLYGNVKLRPGKQKLVTARIEELLKLSKAFAGVLPSPRLKRFFSLCYSKKVFSYLIAARSCLDWRNDRTDATLMAILLIYLHGKRGQSLSNQMRQGKAMSPEYSIQWWEEKKLLPPPDIDPVAFLKPRIEWRYEKGKPNFKESRMLLGDSTSVLRRMGQIQSSEKFNLLFTSPPYCDVTNYHYDQWLRLWMLGDEAEKILGKGTQWRGKFRSRENYKELLTSIFGSCAELMKRGARIYVRTDAREFTFQTTMDALKTAFPNKSAKTFLRPFSKPTQTALYGDKNEKPGEIDILMS